MKAPIAPMKHPEPRNLRNRAKGVAKRVSMRTAARPPLKKMPPALTRPMTYTLRSENTYDLDRELYKTDVQAKLSEVERLPFKKAPVAKEVLLKLRLRVSCHIHNLGLIVLEAAHQETHEHTEPCRGSSYHEDFAKHLE